MMQLANSTFYMSGAEARLSPHSNSSTSSHILGPSTATVHRLRKSDNPRRSSSRASSLTTPTSIATTGNGPATEEEASPDEMHGQSSSSAPISPTLSPSSRLMLKRKQINASMALRSSPFSTSSSACSTSSSAASSLVSFGSSSKTNSLKSNAEENLASRLRNLQISELIDAILLVEGKLKKEQKMIGRELRSRDLQIRQQLKEIERYRLERKQNLCGFCQKKMDNVSPLASAAVGSNSIADRITNQRSVQVQTEGEAIGFKSGHLTGESSRNSRSAAADEEIADDWYANGNSDNENEKSPVNLYERGVNPVLERVNQILLQESTDDAEAAAMSSEVLRAAAPLPQLQHRHQLGHQVKVAERKPTTTSTATSTSTRMPEMIRKATPIGKCNPIVKRPPAPPQIHPPMLLRAHSSPMQHGKENEYEVIGSEQDSSNYYMDMQMQSPIDAAKSFAMSMMMPQPPPSSLSVQTAVDEVEYKNVMSRKDGLELLKLIAPHPGMPPALPPKPANLMKFKKVVPPTKIGAPNSGNGNANRMSVKSRPAAVTGNGLKSGAIEPDYCSISECGANNSSSSGSGKATKTMTMSGSGGGCDDDIDETASKASEDTLENMPKLPNVAAIIVPKKQQQPQMTDSPGGNSGNSGNSNNNSVVINKDNYITKSVMSLNLSPVKISGPGLSSNKAKESPVKDETKQRFIHSSPLRNGNATLVERRQNLMHRLSMQQHSHHGMMMKRYSMDALSPQLQPEELKLTGNSQTAAAAAAGGLFEERIQAEFDWYNLDAEFGKFNAQDVIKEAKSSGSESGSVSGAEEEKRPAKMALDRGLGELREIERKMTTLERKRLNEQRKDGANKEMVHFC